MEIVGLGIVLVCTIQCALNGVGNVTAVVVNKISPFKFQCGNKKEMPNDCQIL